MIQEPPHPRQDYEIDIRIEEGCWPYSDAILESIAKHALAAVSEIIDARPFSEVSIAMITDEANAGAQQAISEARTNRPMCCLFLRHAMGLALC